MLATIRAIAQAMKEEGIDSYLVGGCVRDELLGLPVDDYDVCLVNSTDKDKIDEILRKHCDSVIRDAGSRFPVWIAVVGKQKIDYAIARRENLVGKTRKDFDVVTDNVTIEEDLRRRDLTINAIAKNILTEEYIDPYNGRFAILHRLAHPVSEAFAEDSLRVIRAARFIARFSLQPTPELVEVCKSLKPTDISNERVGMEVMKTLKSTHKPSIFFNMLRKFGWLGYYFQELEATIDCPQHPRHHPEGDVYTHTMHCVDYAQDWFTRTVMLCHDLGKVHTTTMKIEDRAIQSIGHEDAGVDLTKAMLKRIFLCSHDQINQIACLVKLHMIRGTQPMQEKIVRRTLRRLMHYGIPYSRLTEVCKCDVSGRPPLPPYTPNIGEDMASQLLEDDEMTPVVTGDDLLALGLKGPDIGNILKTALELQDRGTLKKGNWKKVLKGCRIEALKGLL